MDTLNQLIAYQINRRDMMEDSQELTADELFRKNVEQSGCDLGVYAICSY